MKRTYTYLIIGMGIAELVLILVSWLLSATMTEGVRSLLTNEGIRWFFGHFTEFMLSPLLIWLILLSMAGGALFKCGLLFLRKPLGYREQTALRFTAILAVLCLAVVVILAFVPHAILLSATGRLFPSPFSQALVPMLCLYVTILSMVYGIMSGHFLSFVDAIDALSFGIKQVSPLFPLYILAIQLYQSVCYVCVL